MALNTVANRKDWIIPIREQIYLDTGYYIIRNFIEPHVVDYLVRFWQENQNEPTGGISKNKRFFVGCPNYSDVTDNARTHQNFFWNRPKDRVTYNVCWRAQSIRNEIEGNPASENFLPFEQTNLPYGQRGIGSYRATSFRIVGTANETAVPLHQDWMHDHSRIQMSLILSSREEDYLEGGFVTRGPDGELRNLGSEEELRAGDLLLFLFSRDHAVEPIKSNPGQRGFWRILFPIETIQQSSPLRRTPLPKRLAGALRQRARQAFRKTGQRPTNLGKFETPPEDYGNWGPDLTKLMSLAIRHGMAPADVYYHNGLFNRWNVYRDWQFNILIKQGLQPQHHVLDIGCGPLRLGLKLIDYLDDGHYSGIDPLLLYIELGDVFAKKVLTTGKNYNLLCDRDFNFQSFQRKFDFAMAQSVFTHLSKREIERCFANLRPVMADGGIFIFTVLINPNHPEREELFLYNADSPMVRTVHRDTSFYEDMASRYGFRLESLGLAGHISQQVFVAHF